MNEFWDKRYSSQDFVYGTEPNFFFKNKIDKLKPGKLLSLAEGEGRNGIYAASLGWNVHAVDFSNTAREKALKLAAEKNLKLIYEIKDLCEFIPSSNEYDAVAIIFVHLNAEQSKLVHKRAAESLKVGGMIILEVYSKNQFGKESGGPQNLCMLYSKKEIENNFHCLRIETLAEENIHLEESKFHSGDASVIRFIGVKIK
jgi:cyclopropane fatty-acyl-phospholipid synthase-like methyltransferase